MRTTCNKDSSYHIPTSSLQAFNTWCHKKAEQFSMQHHLWWNLSFFSFCRSFQQKSPLCIHLLCVVGKNLGIQQSPVNQLTVILSENSELMIDRQWITVRWEELVTIIINSRGSVCRENSGQSSLFWPDASAHDVPSQLISSFCPNNWMLRLLMTVDSKIFGLHRMIKKC